MKEQLENLISDAMWTSGSVVEIMRAIAGDSISVEAAYGIRHLAEETYRMICEI